MAMQLKIVSREKGLHPSEEVVSIETKDGRQELVVDPAIVSDDSLPVGWPVGREDGYLLVELPRQTMSGGWRVWVNETSLVERKIRATA